jgi:hypothetical protein
MSNTKIARQFRQGDVLLQPVAKIPASAKRVDGKKDIVLAEGEVTGHAHRIKKPKNRVAAYFDGPTMYLEVNEPVTVDHEEHGQLTLPPGCYERRLQTETWMDEVRQVLD